MKKFLSVMACLAVVLVGGIMLASCGQEMRVRLASGDVTISAQKFNNGDKLKIANGKKENDFVVSGTANTLTEDQAKVWGNTTTYKGKAYVILEVDFKAGTKVEYTGVMGDNKTNSNDTEEDDVLQLVRVVENNEKTFEVKVTEKGATESTTYTITFDLENYKQA